MRNFVVVAIICLALLFGARESYAGKTYHVVKEGETADSISDKYGVNLEELASVNELGHNLIISIGQKLKIPTNKTVYPKADYCVKSGDTVKSIIEAHRIPDDKVDEFKIKNGIGRNNLIEVGQKLVVSDGVELEMVIWAMNNHINLLPGKCAPYIERMKIEAKKHGFDWWVLPGLVGNESSCDPGAIGLAGEESMYQFLPETARMVIKKHGLKGINLFDPDDATEVAALHFADLLRELNGDYERAIAAWNMGKEEARRLKKPSDWLYVKRVKYIYRLFV